MKSAHFSLASIYAHQQHFQEAAAEYTSVMRLDPNDNEALVAKISALIDARDYTDALDSAKEYTHREPADLKGELLLGTVYSELGEYGRAEEELARAAAGMPKYAPAQYEIGRALARDQKPAQALPYLEKSIALDPSNTSAQYQLVHVLRALGDRERSQKMLEMFNKTNGQYSAAQTNQANEYLHSGQPAKAVEVYRQILETNEQDAGTEYNLALALAALQDREGERKALEKAISLDSNMAAAKLELGRVDLAAGNIESAKQWLDAALETDPQLAPAKDVLGVIYAMRSDDTKAENLFRQAIEDDPTYTQAYADLGRLLADQRKFKAAEEALSKAMTFAPVDLQVLSAAGEVEERAGKYSEAVVLLRKIVTLEPQSVDAHLNLARALAESYDLRGALMETSAAIKLTPSSPIPHFDQGRILFYLGRNQEAQLQFETACRLAPQMAESSYFLAMIKKQAGDYRGASVLFQDVVKLQPRNVPAWYQLGTSLEHELREKDAVAAWRQAVAIDPEHIQSLSNLARALAPTAPAEAAGLEAHLAAVREKENLVDQARTLAHDAIASMRADDWPEAMKTMKEAIQICGDCDIKADLHKNMGLISCNVGDLDQGEVELQLARALRPGDPQVERALEMVAQVRAAGASPEALVNTTK